MQKTKKVWGVYQVADNDLRSGLDSQMERGEFGCILNPGVDISLDADKEQDTFDVWILHSHVEKIPSFVVHLDRNKEAEIGRD